jgi:WD40 repeat protein
MLAFVTASSDNTMIFWNLYNYSPYRILTGHTLGVYAITGQTMSEFIISASNDFSVKVWK